MVRCKMVCIEKGEVFNQWAGNGPQLDTVVVKLAPVSGEQNKTWSKYTPSGSIELRITNPEAQAQFQAGKTYFVDFTETSFGESADQQ